MTVFFSLRLTRSHATADDRKFSVMMLVFFCDLNSEYPDMRDDARKPLSTEHYLITLGQLARRQPKGGHCEDFLSQPLSIVLSLRFGDNDRYPS
ncbi:hypothetical protein CC2G_012160 [Coprinopsis cinerea AmutBmut pab1-1]|nr:hypothetical protein CC2G_012160 [Coprinopsis cinerea AmutBmut pab1-1]